MSALETYVIHTTKECNMKCLYCYERDKTTKLTWDQIKENIESTILKDSPSEFNVEFLGGEPMLEYDFIVKSIDLLENSCKNVKGYGITTNGTIINESLISLMKNNKKLVFSISLDGNKFANQLRIMKDGKNSYDIAMKNISILLNNNIEPGIHIVTHPYNVAYLYDSVIDLYKNGIRIIELGTVESTIAIDMEYCNRFLQECDRISKSIISGQLSGLHIGQFEGKTDPNDCRTYIYDENNTKLLETYGRVEDFSSKRERSDLRIERCKKDSNDETRKMILFIRDSAYNIHQSNIKNSQ